jgi:putative transcriptional regulator
MTIRHHLDEATLMSFAAGSLPAALAAAAAAHVAMCARCRREVAMLESVGEALVAELAPQALARAEAPDPVGVVETGRRRKSVMADGELPWPISQLVGGGGLDVVKWRWLGPGVWHHPLPIAGAGKLRLVKAAPRRAIPEHGHGGAELTLVLRGALRDVTGRYARGDVADLDETIEHKPVAEPGAECICLVASERPEEFRGRILRHLQRLRRN